MTETVLSADVLDRYPPVDEERLSELLQEEITADTVKYVILDDDPTGVQTVHDINVYTDWSADSMIRAFEEPEKMFYLLTNSRAMTAEETERAHREIFDSLHRASAETGKRFRIVCRSDSTLRGHFPLETEVLRQEIEKHGGHVDGEILCPFFREGGRYTLGNTHYVRYGEELVPASQTEFAKDRTFGFSHSYLPEYIEEKTEGKYSADKVLCISLEQLRAGDLDGITEQLMQVTGFNKVCVNAVDYCDVKTFCIALYRAMHQGKSFLFRTAAGFVKALGNFSDIPLLTRSDMVTGSSELGGVIVVGSHTEKTTKQLQELLTLSDTVPVEFHSGTVLDGDDAFYAEVSRCVKEEEKIILSGKTAVCYTERTLLEKEGDTRESALLRSVKISDGVQRLVGELSVTPSFVIAKGGITSSDVGTKALHVKKARVLGQIRPGIPVWQTGEESRFPGIPYVIFPGNVGEVSTLREAAEILIG